MQCRTEKIFIFSKIRQPDFFFFLKVQNFIGTAQVYQKLWSQYMCVCVCVCVCLRVFQYLDIHRANVYAAQINSNPLIIVS